MHFLLICLCVFAFPVFSKEVKNPVCLHHGLVFFEKLPVLLQQENWSAIVLLGEKSLELGELFPEERFKILDQLVSSYFRLGCFEEAEKKADQLILLAQILDKQAFAVDSLYKLSVALRGRADSEVDLPKQRELFAQSRQMIEKAFGLLEEKCSGDKALRARVLFNRGAVHCDDKEGNVPLGITYYQEALLLFQEQQEVDFVQRISVRLGKAYFLVGDLVKSQQIIEQIKTQSIDKRTYMHLLYLEAQVCLKAEETEKALQIIQEGEEIAVLLQAKHDIRRFQALR